MNVVAVTAATLFGRITDAAGEPLIQASVRLLSAKDSTVVKGVVTNESGRFSIANVNTGKYIVEASYVGYTTQTRDVAVADKDVRLKPFALEESAIALRDAVVTGIRTPIKVMEDTIEYSAESYKTQPNAVVEDLLKRLPGVEVSSDGKITANGQEVKKVLVNGKEFFSDDPTVASKNLPVDIVEKLQVVNRKSDLARLTGVDDGEDETVINLTVKKGMDNGWFGNAEAGYGTDDRYKGNFTVNRFWNGNQITFLGGANNVNEPGFADGASGRFRRFGGDNGITSSKALGVNFNVGNGEILRVGGNVLYSHTDRDTRTSSDRQRIFADSTSLVRSAKDSRDKGHNFRADFRVLWNPDSFNTLEFRPNVSLNYNDSWSVDSSLTYADAYGRRLVTNSFNTGTSSGNSVEFGGSLIYNHKFRSRPGRAFSVMAEYKMSNVHENSDTYSRNLFHLFNDSTDIYDQYADNHTWSNSVTSRLSWTEPIGKSTRDFMTLEYRFSYRWNNADKYTYDRRFPEDAESWLDFNSSLSNSFRNDFMNHTVRLGYRHVTKNANLNVGFSVVPQSSESKNLIDSNKDIPRRNVVNYAPFLRYRLKMSKTRSLMAFYNGRSSQPSMSQLQPVADMSNPLNIVIGNPNLNPTFTHSAHVRFQDFNSEAQRSIMAMIDGQMQQNAVVSKVTSDSQTGGRTTTYENVSGVWSLRGMNMISFPLRNKAFTINNHIFLNYSSGVGFEGNTRYRSGNFSVNESFGIAWRPENLEFELRPSYGLRSIHYSIPRSGGNNLTHNYGGSFYGTYYTPVGIVIGTDLNYTATTGMGSFDTRTWMWNATLSYQFLRGKAMTVSLKAYDILGQRSNVQRSMSTTEIIDSRYNSLGRYFLASVSYKFSTMQNGKRPTTDNFGPGGPGGEGGPRDRGQRPSGPPPGGMRPGGF